MLIQISIIALFATILLFAFDNPVLASSTPPALILSKPTLKSISTPAGGVTLGQQLIITSTVTHGEYPKGPIAYIVFLEVRDPDGVTQYLAYQSGKIPDDEHTEVGASWTVSKAGSFVLRTFAISDFENPQILSQVYESTIYVAAQCSGIAECIQGTVTRIVDGDTLDIGDTRIRLALVNTPEIGAAGYDAALEFTSRLCPLGSEVTADEDDGQTQGSFGRMIVKLTCGDKILNAELLNNGYAEILSEYCSVSEFSGEDWARYGCEMTDNLPEKADCDPSYPDVCIPSFPPDLDCSEISFRNFRVLTPDPHHFDGDKDGLGCEG